MKEGIVLGWFISPLFGVRDRQRVTTTDTREPNHNPVPLHGELVINAAAEVESNPGHDASSVGYRLHINALNQIVVLRKRAQIRLNLGVRNVNNETIGVGHLE